jgi:hypothetical protein
VPRSDVVRWVDGVNSLETENADGKCPPDMDFAASFDFDGGPRTNGNI